MSQTSNATTPTNDQSDHESDEQNDDAKLRAKRRRARRILLIAFLCILVSLGLHAVWPWLMSPFIWEGPMLQGAGEHEVTLVWYMTRPVEEGLSVQLAGAGKTTSYMQIEGRRCRAVLTGLEPGCSYPYEILHGQRVLAQDQLRTNKPAGVAFSLVVFGDSGSGSQEQYLLAAEMDKVDPDFLLHTGDVVYGAGERHKYRERFFKPYRWILQRVNLWPSLGNHDLYEPSYGEPYFEIFELPENGPPDQRPERHYWFDYACARIAVVDSNVDEAAMREKVAPWLQEVMTDTAAEWKFVVFHHPPYTGGRYDPDQRIQRTLVPVFEATGVDVVFNGHDHMYQRIGPLRAGQITTDNAGVAYIITAAGGARIYEALPEQQRPDYVAALNDKIHSFTHVTIEAGVLTLGQIGLDGQIIDQWTLVKPQADAESP